MADQQIPMHPQATDRQVVDCGGLRFEATFRARRALPSASSGRSMAIRSSYCASMISSRAPTTTSPRPATRCLSIRRCWESLLRGSSPSYAIILVSYSTRRGSLGSSLASTSMPSLSMQTTSERQWKPACPTATCVCLASACGEALPDPRVTTHRPLWVSQRSLLVLYGRLQTRHGE